ncbi:MAG: Piwi domain-containing protein, partial [Candidatus Helarchaeota archaeon]
KFQRAYQEIMDELDYTLNFILEHFKNKTDKIPKHLFIVRDGVSDNQFPQVIEKEINPIKKIARNWNINDIIYVVVKKGVHIRLFEKYGADIKNPSPGIIVDAPLLGQNEFLLISSKTSVGTITPSHYVVLENALNADLEKIGKTLFFLCFLYWNFASTINIPAPVQYAHRAAYIVGEILKEIPREQLWDKPYFL